MLTFNNPAADAFIHPDAEWNRGLGVCVEVEQPELPNRPEPKDQALAVR
jgi:hypothetical protein